jgi:O-antigen/teichoic acid export membrane protein
MSSFSFKDLLKGSSWIVLATTVARLSGFVVLFILARVLTPDGLGMYNLVQTSIQNGDALSRIGVDISIHRNGSQHSSNGAEFTGRLFGVGAILMVGFSILLAIFLFFNQNLIATKWLNQPKIEPWLNLIALTIFISTLSNPPWLYLLALHSFRIQSIRTSTASIISAFITIILAFLFGLSGAIGGLTVTAIIQVVLGWSLAAKVLKENNIKLRLDKFISQSRGIFAFGLPFYASNSLSALIALPLLGYISSFGGLEQLGFLRVAQSLSQLISFLPAAISPVIISTLSANLVSDPEEYQKIKSLHLRITWTVMMLLSSIICFSLDYLLPVLFGSVYNQAILLSRLTIWITVIGSLSAILNQYVVSAGKMRSIMLVQAIGLIVHTALAVLLIPIYNSTGLLIAQAASFSFTAIAYIFPALQDTKSSDKKMLFLLLVMNIVLILFSICLPLFFNKGIFILLADVICFTSVSFILFAKVFTSVERHILFDTVNTRFKKKLF